MVHKGDGAGYIPLTAKDRLDQHRCHERHAPSSCRKREEGFPFLQASSKSMMDGARQQPPQPFKPAGPPAWVRAELAVQSLSGLEKVRAA